MVEEMKDMPDFEINRGQIVTGTVVKIEDKQAFLKRMHELHVKAIGE